MARLNNNLLKLQGHIARQIVFMQYGDKAIARKFPDMNRVKPSRKQSGCRSTFKDAIAYAKRINRYPVPEGGVSCPDSGWSIRISFCD